ncbi:hypothetical protein BKA70DRAFT_1262517 [Coprinopsis sp. MPI-PUGE-AT-0042]|nr:hypothetical protein BKA70DRAFT_1262517 [Coprinopsis sp. MPI-PUGE-AT-0042]
MPSLKMHLEAYLDACGFVLQRYKSPRYYYLCSNPNCHFQNFVQGYSQVWPCGASYGGKPCVGQYYVWKHHAAAVNAEVKSRDPDAERIRALKEKRRLEGTENTPISMSDITGKPLVPHPHVPRREEDKYTKYGYIHDWTPAVSNDRRVHLPPRDVQPTHVRYDSVSSTSKPRRSVEPCPQIAPTVRPLPHSSPKPTAAKTTTHKTNSLSSSGPLPPPSRDQNKKTSSRSERAPGDTKSPRHPADATREHRRADIEVKEPLPPKLPPKDAHRTRGAYNQPSSNPSAKQPGLASPRQERSNIHKPARPTGSSQSPGGQVPASPLSAKHHTSSRHTASSQPIFPSDRVPAKSPRDVSVLPPPGVLASRRAVSPPPLRRQPDMQRMAPPVGTPTSRPTKF